MYPQYQNPQARRPAPVPPRRPAFANLHSGLPPAAPRPPVNSAAMQGALNAGAAQGVVPRPPTAGSPNQFGPGGIYGPSAPAAGWVPGQPTGPRPVQAMGTMNYPTQAAPNGEMARLNAMYQARQQGQAQQRGPAYRPAFDGMLR